MANKDDLKKNREKTGKKQGKIGKFLKISLSLHPKYH
jgi:hypothetical protein